MSTEAHRLQGRRSLLLLAASVALLSTGCVYVVSGDEEMLDEFAHFKARGGVCLPDTGGGEEDEHRPLEGAERYRWLVYRGLLSEVVTPAGLVRYGEANDDAELREAARLTVRQLRDVDATRLASGPAKLSFWINAYNALTLDGAARAVAEDPGFRVDKNSFAFFDQEVHVIGGDILSLNQIENGIIRGDEFHPSTFGLAEEKKQLLRALHDDLWGGGAPDPRFHFVINCASSSCPPLLATPLDPATLEQVLQSATQAFLDDEERGAGPSGISQIFSFYFTDFEAGGGIEAFLARYRDLDDVDTTRFLPYDWGLNAAPQ